MNEQAPATPGWVKVCAHTRTLHGIVAIGLVLRVWAWMAGTPFWLDEILLSRNILELPLGTLLTEPLELDQVAPRGFLLLERLALLLPLSEERALRLLPLVSAIIGLLVFRRVAERILTGVAVPIAVATVALGVPFIKYGAEVKQYSLDATAGIILLALALRLVEGQTSRTRMLLVGASGLLVSAFSQASVLVMAAIGVALAVEWLLTRDRAVAGPLFTTIPLWAVAALVAIVIGKASMTPATQAFMDDFWRAGFMPLPLGFSSLSWSWQRLVAMFSEPQLMALKWPGTLLIVTLLGFVCVWRRRRLTGLLLVMPLCMALLAAAAQQFPFLNRLSFYLLPFVLLGFAAGVEWLRVQLGRVHSAAGVVAPLLALVPWVTSLAEAPPPYDVEHTRTMLAALQQRRQPGDRVYVFPLTRVGVLFYGREFGLRPEDVITMRCSRNDSRDYLHDADQLKGAARVWMISSIARPFRTIRPAVRNYLGTIGVHRDSVQRRSRWLGTISLDLYDLSDSTRWSTTSAATFAVEPLPNDPRPGCRPWSMPDFTFRPH